MHRIATANPSKSSQRGITLIESLVAIVLAALGILGILGVQMRTLTDTSTTLRRAQAIRLTEDLSERMKANPNALAAINSYTTAFGDTPSITACPAPAGCDHQQLAAYDLALWKQSVASHLPMGKASVFVPPAEGALAAGLRRQVGVMIAWRENERYDSTTDYKDQIDATKVRAADGTLSAGAGAAAACPDGHTCHLQYVPVAGRCAPYSPGGKAATYFCPGS